jgi:hypothetical protein
MGGGFVMAWPSEVPRSTERSVGTAMNATGTAESAAPEGMGVIIVGGLAADE